MADTGFKTTVTVESAGTWSNFTTAKINTSDNDRAIAANNTYRVAQVSDFAFNLPAGATIDGIECQAEFSADITDEFVSAFIRLSLSYNDGTNFTATKEDHNHTTTDSVKTYGGATDKWGRAWTAAELAAGVFRVKVEGKHSWYGQSCRLDYFAVKVYYTPAAGPSGVKTINDLALASVKTINDVVIGSVKTINA